jgi:hypothetical protein
MTTFDDREQAFERRFAHDAEVEFRVTARRNKLLGLWAADRLNLTPAEAEAYAVSIVQADFEDGAAEDGVVRKIFGDLTAAGADISEHAVRRALEEKHAEARRQLIEAS